MQILIQQPTLKPGVTSVKFESKKKVIGNGTVENATLAFLLWSESNFPCGDFFLGTQKKGKSFDDATHPILRSCPYRDENSISENANMPNMIL